ncbi:thiamine ABC transporter substrate binding subunit [Pseudoruegeria sp. HB172150]|uniref:thiamine ABC transporter substrate binding subunit n=1 Tax=Pseudoruegeria sp. HB172150 TaxID=2721164 RepID=UPI0015550256|nr:thiamine ABC transporter substrate binding subunit [Pseudoruegeria sp. HB172150]
MRYSIIATALFAFAQPALAQDKPVLTVYAPDYFGSEWGPGPAIEEGFEARCDCDLEYSIGALLPRLLLEGEDTKADIVIGFNTDVTKRARETWLFAPHGQDNASLDLPIEWTDDIFLPFNWGHTAFVYDTDRVENPPKSFAELLERDDLKIVIQDPRTSASGLALLLWVKAVFGDEAGAAWKELDDSILTVTKGWSESYGMFTDGEADMVLSYTTSPAYHLIAEDDPTVKAAIFPEGHYFMTELVAQVKGTGQPDLAQAFMDYILTEEFQSTIPTANWSLPAKMPEAGLPDGFDTLDMPEKALFYDENEADALREPALAEWLEALS